MHDWQDPCHYIMHALHMAHDAEQKCVPHADVLCIPIGNTLMRNRQPFRLRRFSVVHNAVLFSLSLYMCIKCIRQSHRNFGWGHKFQLWCNPNDGGRSPSLGFSNSGRALANVLWVQYVSKVTSASRMLRTVTRLYCQSCSCFAHYLLWRQQHRSRLRCGCAAPRMDRFCGSTAGLRVR
jgi:GNS1/SUR4 family